MTIDRSAWQIYEFGDIARNLTISVKDPLSEGFERFIGLEHIEPGNIHLKSWGNIADGTSFTRVFRKGQVLFGKRRSYQRKAALAEFDGICSGDILVFEANEENIVPDLLPFIVQSDKFFDHAIKTSAGSLSPRTKFKDLAKLKFKLPPLDEQNRLADLLWSVEGVIAQYQRIIELSEVFKQSLLIDLYNKKEKSVLKPKKFELLELEKLVQPVKGSLRRGPFGSTLRKELFVKTGIKVYEQSNVIYNDFNRGEYYISNDYFQKVSNFEIFPGEILISCSGTVGKIAIFPKDAKRGIMNQALLKIAINNNLVLPQYFCLLFDSEYMKQQLLKKQQGSAMKNLVALNEMKKIKFAVIDIESQKKFLNIFSRLRHYYLKNSINQLKQMVINRIFD